METLTRDRATRVRNWFYRNARPLETALWKFHFESGSPDDVVSVLSAYQNDDGGFGHAIEADNWNPDSSPISTACAAGTLEEIGFRDGDHPLVRKILGYLEETPEFTGEYWPAQIRTNDLHPHAPWWTHTDTIEADWGYNPTAKLAGFILRFADRDSGIFRRAERIAEKAGRTYLTGTTPDGKPYRSVSREGEIECLHYLLGSLEDSGGAMETVGIDTASLAEALREQASRFIERDPSKWTTYSRKPSFYIDSPESPFYPGNERIMDEELDFIVRGRNADGVWDITWRWGAYEREFAISETWWKAVKVIWNMKLLRAFGRLEGM